MTDKEISAQETDYLSMETDQDEKFDLVRWRREQVLKLRAKGHTIDEIVKILKADHPDVRISHGTVFSDLQAIKEEANRNLQRKIEEELPLENRIALAGVQEIIKTAWELADSTKDEKVRLSALQLLREAYLTRQALLGDSAILYKAISWLEKVKRQLSITEDDDETSTPQDVQAARVVGVQY